MDTMLYIRPTNEQDKIHIASWLNDRALNGSLSHDLPTLGLITYYETTPVAAGFLRRVEGNYCMLDSLITNKNIPSDYRDMALDYLVPKLINLAKSQGFTKIIAFSQDKHTLIRSLKHGFVHLPHTPIALDLSGV